MCIYRVTIALDKCDVFDWLLDVSTLSCHSRKRFTTLNKSLVATYLHCRLYWMGLPVQNVLKSRMLLKLVEFTRDGFENIATK